MIRHFHDWTHHSANVEFCVCGRVRFRIIGEKDMGWHGLGGQSPADIDKYIVIMGRIEVE